MLDLDVTSLETIVGDAKTVLKDGLAAMDIWDRETGLSLAGHNPQPEAVALFNQLTGEMSDHAGRLGLPRPEPLLPARPRGRQHRRRAEARRRPDVGHAPGRGEGQPRHPGQRGDPPGGRRRRRRPQHRPPALTWVRQDPAQQAEPVLGDDAVDEVGLHRLVDAVVAGVVAGVAVAVAGDQDARVQLGGQRLRPLRRAWPGRASCRSPRSAPRPSARTSRGGSVRRAAERPGSRSAPRRTPGRRPGRRPRSRRAPAAPGRRGSTSGSSRQLMARLASIAVVEVAGAGRVARGVGVGQQHQRRAVALDRVLEARWRAGTSSPGCRAA